MKIIGTWKQGSTLQLTAGLGPAKNGIDSHRYAVYCRSTPATSKHRHVGVDISSIQTYPDLTTPVAAVAVSPRKTARDTFLLGRRLNLNLYRIKQLRDILNTFKINWSVNEPIRVTPMTSTAFVNMITNIPNTLVRVFNPDISDNFAQDVSNGCKPELVPSVFKFKRDVKPMNIRQRSRSHFKPYSARPHRPLACARILSNRMRGGAVDAVQVSSMVLYHVSEVEVAREVQGLKSKKSCDKICTSVWLLKQCYEHISAPLTQLINASFEKEIFHQF
ncbi:hypothetical protein J6590_060794 [Homalodisca vitripennis]|nr:hypothetical protein J6590_060794 [Homalodisca vitripennis]